MKKYEVLVLSIIFSVVLIMACGGSKKAPGDLRAANYFPQKIEPFDIERKSEIRTFVGDSLYEYINGGAEIYHLYDFIEVATADYRCKQTEIVVDIYRFDNADDAYGLYSMIRPNDPRIVQFGVEGFVSTLSLDFVKGSFLVRLVGYDESSKTELVIDNLAKRLNELIPGTTNPPAMFSLLPLENKIRATDKYYSGSFLGRKFMTCVYSQDYILEGDTLTLFLTADDSDNKFRQWSEIAVTDDKIRNALKGLSYDDENVFMIIDNYYGKIVAGLKSGRLLGVVNYNEKHKAFLTVWLNSLP
jgi:hypothetical protein